MAHDPMALAHDDPCGQRVLEYAVPCDDSHLRCFCKQIILAYGSSYRN